MPRAGTTSQGAGLKQLFFLPQMWKFTQSRWVVRKEVATVTKLCAEDVKDFLEHVAVVRVSRGWEFALPYDEDFVRKHPDVARRQHMLWTGIQAKYA
ncbi:DNA-directed RNA polymerase III subunit RPC5-like, partial [Pteropus vampyrus]|uniref:DNA-directed RNA polymerase III subunit RPC5-like n=1 Tax=Pteropus vampyrus TaxID=132908 RepID=A0A6P3RQN4_PTEVA